MGREIGGLASYIPAGMEFGLKAPIRESTERDGAE